MFTRVHHIGIAVSDLEQAAEDYRRSLDMEFSDVQEVQGGGVRLAFFPVGESSIELVQPTDPDSGLARFLEKRGEGIHHICLEVEDVHAALEELQARGVVLIDKEPREGGEGLVAFLHPKGMHGVLIELIQTHAE
ncbi:MAG: methylmalonyl-CoA epimerase [Anaerolineae bacterium]